MTKSDLIQDKCNILQAVIWFNRFVESTVDYTVKVMFNIRQSSLI